MGESSRDDVRAILSRLFSCTACEHPPAETPSLEKVERSAEPGGRSYDCSKSELAGGGGLHSSLDRDALRSMQQGDEALPVGASCCSSDNRLLLGRLSRSEGSATGGGRAPALRGELALLPLLCGAMLL